MIKIGNAEKDYYSCQSCDGLKSVNKITIGVDENSTHSFRVCDFCLMKIYDNKIEQLKYQLAEQQERLESAESILKHLVYSSGDSQALAYEHLEKYGLL